MVSTDANCRPWFQGRFFCGELLVVSSERAGDGEVAANRRAQEKPREFSQRRKDAKFYWNHETAGINI